MASSAIFSNLGLRYSLLLHIVVLLNICLYIYKHEEIPNAERIISVELVNIKSGPITNLKNISVKMHKQVNKETIPSLKTDVQPIKETTKPVQTKPAVSTKEIHTQKTVDINKILSKLENLSTVEPSTGNKNQHLAMSDKPYDRSKPITIADHDRIRMQIEKKFFNPIVSEFPWRGNNKNKIGFKKKWRD